MIKGGTHNESWSLDIETYVIQLQAFINKCEANRLNNE
jgi:hypothetical protein